MIFYLEFFVKFFAFLVVLISYSSSLMAEEAEKSSIKTADETTDEKDQEEEEEDDKEEVTKSNSFGSRTAKDEFSNDFHLKEGSIKTIERGMESAMAKFEIIADLFLSG